MPTVKAGKTEIMVSPARVARMADRLWRLGHGAPERVAHSVAAARKRLEGAHPRKRDAAIVLAAITVVGNG